MPWNEIRGLDVTTTLLLESPCLVRGGPSPANCSKPELESPAARDLYALSEIGRTNTADQSQTRRETPTPRDATGREELPHSRTGPRERAALAAAWRAGEAKGGRAHQPDRQHPSASSLAPGPAATPGLGASAGAGLRDPARGRHSRGTSCPPRGASGRVRSAGGGTAP